MLRIKLRRVLSKKKTSSVKLFSSLEHFSALRGGSILGRSVIVRSRVWPKNWAPKLSSLFVSVKDGLISAPNYIHLWVGAIIHFLSFVQRQPGFHDWEVSNAHRRLFLWVFKEWEWKLLNRLIAKSDIKHSPNTTLLLLRIENHNVAFTVFYCFCI